MIQYNDPMSIDPLISTPRDMSHWVVQPSTLKESRRRLLLVNPYLTQNILIIVKVNKLQSHPHVNDIEFDKLRHYRQGVEYDDIVVLIYFTLHASITTSLCNSSEYLTMPLPLHILLLIQIHSVRNAAVVNHVPYSSTG